METELIREALNAETSRLLGVVLAITVLVISVGGFLYARELRKLIADRSAAERSQRETISKLTQVATDSARQQAETIRSISLIIEQNNNALNAFRQSLEETSRGVRLLETEAREMVATLATSGDVESQANRVIGNFYSVVNASITPISDGLSEISQRVEAISAKLLQVELEARAAIKPEKMNEHVEELRRSVDQLRIEISSVKNEVISSVTALFEKTAAAENRPSETGVSVEQL